MSEADGTGSGRAVTVQTFEALGVAAEEAHAALHAEVEDLVGRARGGQSVTAGSLGALLHASDVARRRGEQLISPAADLLVRTIGAERALAEAITAQRDALAAADRANRARAQAEQELRVAREELAGVPGRIQQAAEQAREEERDSTLDVVNALAAREGEGPKAFNSRLAAAMDDRVVPAGMPALLMG